VDDKYFGRFVYDSQPGVGYNANEKLCTPAFGPFTARLFLGAPINRWGSTGAALVLY